MIQINNKLKRVLQAFKEKINRIVIEKPQLFDGVGEETSERLDHLISTVENQMIQISELKQIEHRYQNQILTLEK